MNKYVASMAVVLLLALVIVPAASASGNVQYTYTVADLGQGIWGGGPLFGDGTAGGVVAVSFANGQNIATFRPTGWVSFTGNNQQYVVICFTVTGIKGLPSGEECSPPIAVTGTPVIIHDEDGDFLFRLTVTY